MSQEDNRPSMEAASDAHFAFGYVIVATRPFSMDIISSSKSMLVSLTFKKFACGIESSTSPILVLSNTAVSPVLVNTVSAYHCARLWIRCDKVYQSRTCRRTVIFFRYSTLTPPQIKLAIWLKSDSSFAPLYWYVTSPMPRNISKGEQVRDLILIGWKTGVHHATEMLLKVVLNRGRTIVSCNDPAPTSSEQVS